jgi:hypothetical protein
MSCFSDLCLDLYACLYGSLALCWCCFALGENLKRFFGTSKSHNEVHLAILITFCYKSNYSIYGQLHYVPCSFYYARLSTCCISRPFFLARSSPTSYTPPSREDLTEGHPHCKIPPIFQRPMFCARNRIDFAVVPRSTEWWWPLG